MAVKVLRLGHRFARDHRISTHLALVARAFGGDEILYDVDDKRIKESVDAIVNQWGGAFSVSIIDNWKAYVSSFEGTKVHLTMYGLPVGEVMEAVHENGENDLLVIVGGKKIPADLYHLADYNVACGGQPHSEVAALAVFLDRYFQGEELAKTFKGGKTIVPQKAGKKVIEP